MRYVLFDNAEKCRLWNKQVNEYYGLPPGEDYLYSMPYPGSNYTLCFIHESIPDFLLLNVSVKTWAITPDTRPGDLPPLPTAQELQEGITRKNMAFGESLIVEYGSSNRGAALPEAVVATVSAKLAPIQQLLRTGSLKTCLYVLSSMPTNDPYVPASTVNYFRGKIQAYLEANPQ